MADQEVEQQDFTQDIAEGDFQEVSIENGDGETENDANGDTTNAQDSGSADIPGRDDDRKLFVGGLNWETTEKELKDYFGKFGEIESANVKTDPNTGRSRGFAFIVFKSTESLDKVVAVAEHTINGKKIDPKKAKARNGKIFVGGLKPELTDDEIKKYFEAYGSILEVEMPFDKQKNQRKGFCFITFDQEHVVNDLLKTPKQTINGHQVDVRKATPKPEQMMGRGGPRGGMRGGRGGSRGRGRGYGQAWSQGYGYNQGYGGYGPGYGGYGYDNYGYGGYGYGSYDYSGYGSGYGYGGGQGGYGGSGKSQRGRQNSRHTPY